MRGPCALDRAEHILTTAAKRQPKIASLLTVDRNRVWSISGLAPSAHPQPVRDFLAYASVEAEFGGSRAEPLALMSICAAFAAIAARASRSRILVGTAVSARQTEFALRARRIMRDTRRMVGSCTSVNGLMTV
jgi:hypothetical protein